jgi:isopentenyl-diphosphate delta-isomerase
MMSDERDRMNSHTSKPVVLVDSQDQPIGLMEKLEAHQKGRLHRAFSVMLYRQNKNKNKIEVLLQQRALNKYHGGGLWANTCCSHPFENESVLEAAYRRLKDEIFLNQPEDLALIKLNHLGSFIYHAVLDNGLIEHELDHVCVGEYDPDSAREIPLFNPEEIAQMEWVCLEKLVQALHHRENQEHLLPKRYAPWLPQVLDMLIKMRIV